MTDPRRGMALRELMAIVAVAGVSLGLLARTISRSREEAHRTQCINNAKQLGLGFHSFLSTNNTFPNAGTYGEDPAALASGDPNDSVINHAFDGRFGLIRPGTPEVGPLYNWVLCLIPYLGSPELYNEFNVNRSYLDPGRPGDPLNRRSNWAVTSTDCDWFRCPDDETVVSGQGNLSYVVNGGFSRWHAEGHAYGWAGTARGGANGPTLDWGQSVAEKTGVMFLGSSAGNAPWDHKTSLDQITDGTSSTVLLAENRLVGVSSGTPYSDGVATNWACPHPNFCMFIASDDVCTRGASSGVNCSTVGDLEERSGHGAGWALASRAGLPESVNSGRGLSVEGSSPFPNGNHPGLIIVGMCDGSTRSVRDSIDGSVWAKLVTPAGYSLPPKYCQFPPDPSGY